VRPASFGTFERRKRLLQALVTALGVTAMVTGVFAVLTGPGAQVDGSEAAPSVESEYRFYAAFWIGYGAAALWVAPRVDREPVAVRALAVVLFAGGVARAIAWIASGRPHALFIVLLGLEFVIPVLVLVLQRQLAEPRVQAARRAGRGD
jgi:hypothetical protein